MTKHAMRAGLFGLAALLTACGTSEAPSRISTPPVTPPTDPELPLPPKMRCAPAAGSATVAAAKDCGTTTDSAT